MLRGISFFFIMLIISISVLNAQPRRRTPAERADTLKVHLKLTDAQTSKVEAIYKESDTKLQEAFQNGFDRDQFRAIMDTTNTKIEKLLTDKQKDAFNKLLQERRNRMRRN